MTKLKQITALAHRHAGVAIKQGDRVVDATAGNGYDTIFLAEKVGSYGHVYAFDVQKMALEETRRRLEDNNLEERVTLIRDGHEQMHKYLRRRVAAVMYNLGYLPGGSREITTCHETTVESFKQALNLLKNGGIITVVLYPGHRQGALEKEHLLPYCRRLPPKTFNVLHVRQVNPGGEPPELIVVQKILF